MDLGKIVRLEGDSGTWGEQASILIQEPGQVTVMLNSTGGACADGVCIASLILSRAAPSRVLIWGCCQSAALTVFAAFSERYVVPGTWMMLHGATVGGNVEFPASVQRQWMETMLEQVSINNKITGRLGLTDDERRLLSAGPDDRRFYTASEAVSRGWAKWWPGCSPDELLGRPNQPEIPESSPVTITLPLPARSYTLSGPHVRNSLADVPALPGNGGSGRRTLSGQPEII